MQKGYFYSDQILTREQQIELWTLYEVDQGITEKASSKQLIEEIAEMSTVQEDGISDMKDDGSGHVNFASTDDILEVIEEEIQQKLIWAEANACRAYIGSTF